MTTFVTDLEGFKQSVGSFLKALEKLDNQKEEDWDSAEAGFKCVSLMYFGLKDKYQAAAEAIAVSYLNFASKKYIEWQAIGKVSYNVN